MYYWNWIQAYMEPKIYELDVLDQLYNLESFSFI